MNRTAIIASVLLATAQLACGTSAPDGKAADASAADVPPDPVCTAYCDHAVAGCAVDDHQCLGTCQTSLGGRCGDLWRTVYQCGAGTTLTCNDAGAHPFECLGELSSVAYCIERRDAATSPDGSLKASS
ncbi:MAG TPA: hypothetical protein VNO55_31195 [Polyangia bacterium]|nr:hypothetical protein [Polyangia bacterium]